MTNETPVRIYGLNNTSMGNLTLLENYVLSSLAMKMQYFGGGHAMPDATPIDSNRQFIKLEQSFLNQVQQSPAFFAGQNDYTLQEKMKLSADALLNCNPDKISVQVTDEGSIFYTLLKGGLSIYFQHYLVDEFDGTDEAIVTVYDGNQSVLNFGGTLAEAFNHLSEALTPYSIAFPAFAV